MTILNVHLDNRRALVASNTQGVFPDGTHRYASKILALPHASAVMAGRGQVEIWFRVYEACYAAMTDLDGMASKLEARARQAMTLLIAEAKRQGVTVSLTTEMLLVGWSTSREKMVCHYCRVNDDGSVSVQEHEDWFISPWEHEWGSVPSLASHREMASSAQQQAAHSERLYPRMGWLGDLTLCEITPEAITFTAAKDFWK